MRFKPYPKYKPSGFEWLGDVPEHWEVMRLRFCASLNPSKSEVLGRDSDDEVSFLPMEAIGDDGSLQLDRKKPISEVESGYTYFRNGDIAIAKITPCFENGKGALMTGLVGGIGFGTTELVVVRPNQGTHGKYLNWLFMSNPFRKVGEGFMYGAGGQKRVPDDFVRNFGLGLPDYHEQSSLAAFLDRETAKIDTLIVKQEKLIKLLKEKRQAIISHAVTKGLNPNAKMKDSCVEWLGEVPEHWGIVRVKRLGNICYGIGEPPDYRTEGTPLIRATNVHAGKLLLDEGLVFVEPNDIPEKRIVWLKAGDIVVVRSGAYTGDSAIIPEGSPPYIAGFDMVLRCNKDMSPWFMQYALLSGYLKENQIDLEKMRAAQPHLNSEELGGCFVLKPPIKEQTAIVTWLDCETVKIDALIKKAERAISLQREHRTALISAAVTGKIDVREGA